MVGVGVMVGGRGLFSGGPTALSVEVDFRRPGSHSASASKTQPSRPRTPRPPGFNAGLRVGEGSKGVKIKR